MEVLLFALIVVGIWYVSTQNNTSHYTPPITQTQESPILQHPALQHPVLQYQRETSYDTHPANWGDPIRPLSIGASPSPSGFMTSNAGRVFSNNLHAYGNRGGPHVGVPMGVFVPENAIKEPPGGIFAPISYPSLAPFPAIASVDASVPLPRIRRGWIKLGLLTSHKGNIILDLYGMPINPSQSLFQYQVEDKNGFIIPLSQTDELEDGDFVPYVVGYDGFGPWRVNLYSRNRWVYM